MISPTRPQRSAARRAPRVLQAVNNWFSESQNHKFASSFTGNVLNRGNYLTAAKKPLTLAGEDGAIFNVAGGAGTCSDRIGRDCEIDQLDDSVDFASGRDEQVLTALAEHAEPLVEPIPVEEVQQEVEANHDVGRICLA